MHDDNPIWFLQQVGKEFHVIDYLENRGKSLEWYAGQLHAKPYKYRGHILPHDVKVRELGTGRARFEVLEANGIEVTICRDHKPEDGIAAVRSILPMCWFDRARTETGVQALKAYQAAPAPSLGTMHARPLHNWASHPADAFRTFAIGMDQVLGWSSKSFLGFKLRGLAR